MAEQRVCAADGCCKPRKNGGYCWGHYHRKRRHGNLSSGRIPHGTLPKYLLEVAMPCSQEACLIWPFTSKTRNGYASLAWNGRTKEAHRVICELTHGPSPGDRFHASHECGNGRLGCVNPRHIVWKTALDNNLDKVRHGTLARGEEIASSKLTKEQVREIRSLRGKMKGCDIARIYGVDSATVCEIQLRRTWKWLD